MNGTHFFSNKNNLKFYTTLVFTWLIMVGNATSQNQVTPGVIRIDATYEHISVLWEIDNDTNHNSVLDIAYKVTGSSSYLPGSKTVRAYPSMQVDGSSLNKNHHAGSAMFLNPNTTYDLSLTLTDPDGGSSTQTRSITTKAPQEPSISGNTYYVSPGTGGGTGTLTDPYLGLQTAADNASAGDIFLVIDGNYAPFTITTDGTPGNPIVFKSQNLNGAIIDGNGTNTGIVNIGNFSGTTEYIIIDGFIIQNGYWAINAENTAFITVKNNIIRNVGYGYYNRRENGWEHDQTIENNEFTGTTSWPQSGIPSERCIDIRGNNNVVRYNTIQYFADGVSTDGAAYDVSYSMDIYYNDISYIVDDGIEVDGTISNTRIYRNRVYNSRVGVSLAPINGGPCYVFRNEFFNIEDGYSVYKMNRGPAGIIIANNTSNKLGNGMSSPSGWQNTYLRNNIIMGTRYAFEEFAQVAGSNNDWDFNAYYSTRAGTTNNEWFKWDNTRYANVGELQTQTSIENNGVAITISDLNNATLPSSYGQGVDPGLRNLTLSSISPAINNGEPMTNMDIPFVVDGSSDRGAFEYGQPYPTYGAEIESALPIELVSFKGYNTHEGDIKLLWQTATEIDNEKFDIQRSINGRDFYQIGEIKGSGTSSINQYYSFIDVSPNLGVNYYRLKQIDYDGTYEYSYIISVNYIETPHTIGNFYPNPSISGKVTIDYRSILNENLNISFFDMIGNQVATQIISVTEGSNLLEFDVSSLKTGTYLVQLKTDKYQINRRLTIY